MNHAIDRYADLDSPVHRWDPRLKLVGLGSLVLACAFVTDPRLVPVLVAVAVGLVVLARLPLGFVVRRLRYPGLLVLVVVLVLPFVSGETVLARWGPFAVRAEGVLNALLVAGRFTAIVMVGLVVFATAPMLRTVTALRALRLSSLLADMMLLTYRYLYELGGDLGRMRTATRLRGFRPGRPDRHTLATVGSLTGSLLVRGHDQSARVHRAMILRGHGAAPRHRHDVRAGPWDVAALAVAQLLAAALILWEVL
ncbi:cobalt ECF transporter T component CbiQ [Nocardiopsis oceani]